MRSYTSIYNSRNYKVFIDIALRTVLLRCIYNSRNYKVFIDSQSHSPSHSIYNSRNYKVFIDQVPESTRFLLSTIVEIIRSL